MALHTRFLTVPNNGEQSLAIFGGDSTLTGAMPKDSYIPHLT